MALLFVAVVMYAAASAKKTRERQASQQLGQQRFSASRPEEMGRRPELETRHLSDQPPRPAARGKAGEVVRNQWGDEVSSGHRDDS